MKEFTDIVVFKNRVTHQILPLEFNTSTKGNTTPSVLNVRVLLCLNSAPQSITNFNGGSDNQTIRVLGDGNTTIVNGTNIKTNTGADKLLGASKIYTFTYINNVWYEDAS